MFLVILSTKLHYHFISNTVANFSYTAIYELCTLIQLKMTLILT